jgi:8-hydroxy-5-deazaflavin:NADPH oxidoreductase
MTSMTFEEGTFPHVDDLVVGILGGTGDQGRGLAYRLGRAGQRVIIGSRSAERAAATAVQVSALAGVAGEVSGTTNAAAATSADVVVVAVPWEGHGETVVSVRDQLIGKIVIDCANPIGFDAKGPFALAVPEGSAAEQTAALLPGARVCAAFHHVSAALLTDPAVARLDLDVLVLGDDRDAVDTVVALANRIDGVRGVYAGRLRNAGQVEAFTANLIAINRRYKAHAGIRITDL